MQRAAGINHVRLGNETGRLDALYDLNILDTGPEDAFDRITRLAKLVVGTPIALVSLVDQDRQWFKSKQGIDVEETSRATSFCSHAIKQDSVFIVQDATEDPLFRGNPLVTGEPFIRFYAGMPLRVRGGHNIGTLCVIDRRPRKLSAEQIDALRDLARLAVDELQLREVATSDTLTGALTRVGFEVEIDREIKRAQRYRRQLSLIKLSVDEFQAINQKHGHAGGDIVLQAVYACIQKELRPSDIVARVGGDEFVIALPETDLRGSQVVSWRMRQKIADLKIKVNALPISVTASLGIAGLSPADGDWTEFFHRATDALHEAKASGRNMSVVRESPD